MAKGRKTGGGSRAGKPNKSTADIKAIAQQYGPEAIAVLVQICNDREAPHASRVAAADKLLDRGFGKAQQSVAVSGGDAPIQMVEVKREELLAEVGKVVKEF